MEAGHRGKQSLLARASIPFLTAARSAADRFPHEPLVSRSGIDTSRYVYPHRPVGTD